MAKKAETPRSLRPVWVEDENQQSCSFCTVVFSFLNRRVRSTSNQKKNNNNKTL